MTRTLTIGERIALARDAYKLSQAQLGANLGVTRAAVSQYEQDKIKPRPRVFEKLADLFNSDTEWFEHGRGKRPDERDAPVIVPEINCALLTAQTENLRDLSIGRQWQLPLATFGDIKVVPGHMVAIVAPNDAEPILAGDKVLIDTRRRQGTGVFLVIDDAGPQLRQHVGPKLGGVGRAIAYLRTL